MSLSCGGDEPSQPIMPMEKIMPIVTQVGDAANQHLGVVDEGVLCQNVFAGNGIGSAATAMKRNPYVSSN